MSLLYLILSKDKEVLIKDEGMSKGHKKEFPKY